MKLPDDLLFREAMHGHGARGMYVYVYVDTSGAGVQYEARREPRARIETRAWRHTALVDQQFGTLDALKAALEPVTEEQAAEEAARWPQVTIAPEHEGSPNRCRLCPRDPPVSAVHRVTVKASWADPSPHYAGLCNAHGPLLANAAALRAALDAEVQERIARAARAAS